MNHTSANKNRKIEVCLSPSLLHLYPVKDSIVVVIDIFRATSSICYGIDNGATAIIPVDSVEACARYANKGYLLAAERNGEVVQGYDFGNSPYAYTKEKVAKQTIVLTTTNGTTAIQSAKDAKKIIIGSFLNLDSICHWLSEQTHDVLLLCSGWKNNFNLEDTLFAGAVVHQLENEFQSYCDASVAAKDLYALAQNDVRTYLKKSSHNKRLQELNIEDDILFCLQKNITHSIPVLQGERLVKMPRE